ncbi:MAG: hypothetical protein AB1468_05255 [Candidatus Micrarchaeota archaeon]
MGGVVKEVNEKKVGAGHSDNGNCVHHSLMNYIARGMWAPERLPPNFWNRFEKRNLTTKPMR